MKNDIKPKSHDPFKQLKGMLKTLENEPNYLYYVVVAIPIDTGVSVQFVSDSLGKDIKGGLAYAAAHKLIEVVARQLGVKQEELLKLLKDNK